ncbi:hypothetical protein M422DRAFT_254756 [Sphaerobolus stellatus SS14]|uniref:Protein kinase domain-containing protein n=1 Tax=Sphaerobolus stellatus (strain SS14) TaxID=990650 RepID=A0A0C9VUX0_SPHS4|nr:hypothetical protein M422DRAFT_254756 [Sphaerobolus stellatus SS14]
MSPQIVRKITFWKKSSTKKEIDGLGADWIGDAMKVANLTITAGEAVPGVGGFMKAAGGIFLALLQPLQQMGKNKEDCKTLITNIAQLLQTINKELKTLSSGDITLANSSNAWSDFERSLEETKEKLSKFNSEERFLSRYLRAERIRDIILMYQTEIGRLKDDLLLANVLATRLQVNNIQYTLTASNEDDSEIDDYYQVKPADIYLTETLAASSRSTVEEYLATVNCGGMQKSAMVRRYNGQDKEKSLKQELQLLSRLRHPNVLQLLAVCRSRNLPALVFDGGLVPAATTNRLGEYERLIDMFAPDSFAIQDIISYLAEDYPRSRDVQAAISYLTNKIPDLSSYRSPAHSMAAEYLSILTGGIGRYGSSDLIIRPKIREYRLTDNRVVLSIEFEALTELYQEPGFMIYPEHSINEYLLQKINHPDAIRHLSRDEMVSLLRAFHSIVPLQNTSINDRKNVPLGGVILHLPLTIFEDYQMEKYQPRDDDSGMLGIVVARFKEGVICDSSWHPNNGDDVRYETQRTAKGTRVQYKPQHSQDCNPRFTFTANVDGTKRYGRGGYPPFLAQINSIVPKIKKFWPRLSYDISMCHTISWNVYVKLPHCGKTIRNSPNLYLFLENPMIDASGYPQDPRIYWSTCPSGITSLTVLQLYSLGITDLHRTYKEIGSFQYIYHSQKDVLNSMYEACGLNAQSDEISELMGYPLPEHKEFRFPRLKRRMTFSAFSEFEVLTRTRSDHDKLPELQLDPKLVPHRINHVYFLTAKMVPFSLQHYDLRTTSHDLQYGNLDIDLCHEEMPRTWKYWSRFYLEDD